MSNSKLKEVTKDKAISFADAVKYVIGALGGINLLTVFRTMLIVLNVLAIIFLYNVVTSQQSVEKIIDNIVVSDQEETVDMDIRDQVTPQISSNLKKLMYSLDSDRACVMELHNGKKNATSLPFKYFDMTYEEIHDERTVPYISQNFLSIMVSHYKLPYYLSDKQVFIGDTKALAEIDPRFAANMEKYDGKYIGIMLLRNNGQNIGFIAVSYDNEKYIKSEEEIKDKLQHYGRIIAPLLDLGTQKTIYKLNNKNDE